MVALDLTSFLKKYPDIQNQSNIAVAVSGGPDSMALLGMLHQQKLPLHVLSVDHGLRNGAAVEAQMVAHWCQENALTHHILKWEGDKPDTAIMEAARTARYDLMAQYCAAHNIRYLFIAHHQDDQAETFLMRLSKGSGLDGLAAMQDIYHYNDDLILARPLLDAPKKDLINYCHEQNIPFIHDPSNENEKYLRPRLRGMMDVLAQEGLSAKRLAKTSKRLSRARQALEQISDQVFTQTLLDKTEDYFTFDFIKLKQAPDDIGLRVIHKALETMRPAADYNVRMEKLEELFEDFWHDPQTFKPRTLGGCIFALKDGNRALWIMKENK